MQTLGDICQESTAMRVLITGAKGGLGSAVTTAFLKAGHTVIGVSRSISAADFPQPNFIRIAAGMNQIAEVINQVEPVGAVVHLVGGWTGGAPVADAPGEALAQMLEVNTVSTWQVLRAAVPALRRAGGGRIVAVGSRAAVEPAGGSGAYGAAKAAMVALVRAVAIEEASHGITANCVLPGTMDTAANRAAMPGADRSRWVPTERVASLILWLASEAGASVTGAALPIYGEP